MRAKAWQAPVKSTICTEESPTVDNPLRFVFNVDAHISLVRARGKGKKCGPTQCEDATPDRRGHQFDRSQAAAVESVRRQVPRRALRGGAAATERGCREEHRRGGRGGRSDSPRAQPLRCAHQVRGGGGRRFRGDHQGDTDARGSVRGRPRRADPGRGQSVHSLSARRSEPGLRSHRTGQGQPGDDERPARRLAHRKRRPARGRAGSRRADGEGGRCRGVRDGERVQAGGRSTGGAEGCGGRGGRHRRHHDHPDRAQEPAHHLFARTGVRRQAAHRRSDAPVRPVVRGGRPRQTPGRSAGVVRDRGARAVQGGDGAADQPPAAVLLCRQRIQQGGSGGARRRLRLDRQRGRDGRRAARRALRGRQSARQHVVVVARAGADAGPGRAGADDRLRARPEELRLMAKINLLPWRAERRKQREREFYLMLGMAALAAVAVVVLWYLWMDARLANQDNRNAYLKDQIQQLDKKLTEIKQLEETKSKLLARKQIIEQLQANRSQMVHLFDELVKTIPDGVRLTSLKQSGDTLTLEGVAQSNASVANYMRNLDASPWLKRSDLQQTEAKGSDKRDRFQFGLTVKLTSPEEKEKEKAKAAAQELATMPADKPGQAPAAPPGGATPNAPAAGKTTPANAGSKP